LSSDADSGVLKGTTLRVYRYLFKAGQPEGIRDIQRGLELSSSSVAEYHVKKLLRSGLIRESGDGYVVDRVVWQNMIRMRRTIIPFQAVYAVFLAAAFVVMVLVLRGAPEEGYVFGAIVILVALGFSLFETVKGLRQAV
jgi:predicted DNA-binding transcriptional regulator